MSRPLVAIVGGGITGLTVAYQLERSTGADVVLMEGDDELGGKIRTDAIDGIPIEIGPDSFLPRDDQPLQLCRELGLGDELVEPRSFGAWVWRDGALHRLPEGVVLGVPAAPLSIMRARILSPLGALRAAGDLVLPGPLEGDDVSIGSFIRRRFGREVVERLVDPLLAGTRAGRIDEISLEAGAPQIDAVARRHRSLILGLRSARRAGALGAPRFYSFRGGMVSLVRAIEARLARTRVATACRVASVTPAHGGYSVATNAGPVDADAVVIAAPAPAAAELLAGAIPAASELLGRIEFASAAVGTFVYPPGAVTLPNEGSGFLVPSSESKTVAACTWFSAKWPHLAPGDGRTVLRAFAGRATGDPSEAADGDSLLRRMRAELADALGIEDGPRAERLDRWDRALPQMRVGHLRLVDDIERALDPYPGIALAGAGYRGTGIPDCFAHARAVAARMASFL